MKVRAIDLRNERNKILVRMHEINEAANAVGRDLDAEEQGNWDTAVAEILALDKRIERAEFLEAAPATNDEERRVWDLARDREGGPPATEEEAKARAAREYHEAFRDYISAERTNMIRPESWSVLQRGKQTMNAAQLKEYEEFLRSHLAPAQFRAAMGVGSQTAGGFWVPDAMMQQIEKAMLWFAGMRQFAHVFSTDDGADIPWPVYDDTGNVGRRLAENTTATQTDIAVGLRVLKAFMYTSDEVLVSRQLLQDRPELGEGLISDALGERIGRIQNTEFTTYAGGDGPTGLMQGTAAGVTAGAAADVTADELLDLKFSVNRSYRERPGAGYMMADTTLLKVLKLKDGEGDYYFVPDPRTGGGDTQVWSSPVVVNNDMPTMASGNKSIVYGDGNSYKIRDISGFTLLRMEERYAPQLQFSFLGFARADGGYINAGQDPIKHLVHP